MQGPNANGFASHWNIGYRKKLGKPNIVGLCTFGYAIRRYTLSTNMMFIHNTHHIVTSRMVVYADTF